MKVLVLMQDGIPIRAFNLPKVSRDWELEQFATKVREKHTEALRDAFVVLNPSKNPKTVGSDDLPSVATSVVELENFCAETAVAAERTP